MLARLLAELKIRIHVRNLLTRYYDQELERSRASFAEITVQSRFSSRFDLSRSLSSRGNPVRDTPLSLISCPLLPL